MRISKDTAEMMRQCEVVMITAIRTGAFNCCRTGKNRRDMSKICMEEFGLTRQQLRYCVGRAQNFLAEVDEAERQRNAAKTFASEVEYAERAA